MNVDKFMLDLEACVCNLAKLHDVDCVCRSAKYQNELNSYLVAGLRHPSERAYTSDEERENYELLSYLQHALILNSLERKESVKSWGLFPWVIDFGDVLTGFERAMKNGNTDVACFKKYIDNVVEYVLNDDLSIKTSVSYCESTRKIIKYYT